MSRIEKLRNISKCSNANELDGFVSLARDILTNDLLSNSLVSEVRLEAPQLVSRFNEINKKKSTILNDIIDLKYFHSGNQESNKLNNVVTRISNDIKDLYDFEVDLTAETYYRENGVGD